MVFTIKKKIKSLALLTVFVLSCFSPMLVLGDPKPTLDYSWQETSYDYSLFREWNGNSVVINHSDTYLDEFSAILFHYNKTEGTYIKETRTHYYTGNYSYFSNETVKGYIDIDMNLDVFRVDIEYGKSVDMIWMALKQGTLTMDYLTEQYEKDYSYVEEYYMDIEREFIKFNATTSDIINIWTETSNETGVLNMTIDGDPINYDSFYSYDLEFSLPLILVMQIYTTNKGDKIAWAESFYEYIIYKDKDGDSIYSAGETSNPSTSGFNLYSSNEMFGVVRPMAWDIQIYQEREHPVPSNGTIHQILPFDKTVTEIASTIQFTPPSINEDNIVTWNVEYPQFPINAFVTDDVKPPSEWYETNWNATYQEMSPGDFNYQFDYNLTETQANLDLTLNLSKISDESFYNATQGYGLCLPHYNFFVTSFDINEVDPIGLTVPSDLFTFESNGTTVAEINMINPVKKNYTLYDYPELGIDTQMESKGGSIHKLLMTDSEQNANAGNPFINLIYTIRDIVEAYPEFTIVDDLFHLETQNYPLWNGEKLSHDPTFTIYYENQGTEETPPDDPDPTPSTPPGIPGFDLFVVVGLISAVVVLQALTLKKRFVANRNRIKT